MPDAIHRHDLSRWQHDHDWATDRSASARRTHAVIAITLVTMAAEIGAGWWWQSMALLADGWHMGTHAAAIGVAALAYALARRWAGDARFSLGPWKVEVLGAYTSALLLGVVSVAIAVESVLRLISPRVVDYAPSLWVAAIGLGVNLVCARLLHAPAEDADRHAHADHGAGPRRSPRPRRPPRTRSPSPRARARSRPEPESRLPARAGRCRDLGAGHRGPARRLAAATSPGSIRSSAWWARH